MSPKESSDRHRPSPEEIEGGSSVWEIVPNTAYDPRLFLANAYIARGFDLHTIVAPDLLDVNIVVHTQQAREKMDALCKTPEMTALYTVTVKPEDLNPNTFDGCLWDD